MKKGIMLLLIFTCICIVTVNAQSPGVNTLPNDKSDSALLNRLKDRAFADSLRNAFRHRYNPNINMPLAGAMPKRLNYIGNNRQGFNIYQTPHDNMYILKPDSSFVSNMPVAGGLSSSYKPADMPNPKKEKKD